MSQDDEAPFTRASGVADPPTPRGRVDTPASVWRLSARESHGWDHPHGPVREAARRQIVERARRLVAHQAAALHVEHPSGELLLLVTPEPQMDDEGLALSCGRCRAKWLAAHACPHEASERTPPPIVTRRSKTIL